MNRKGMGTRCIEEGFFSFLILNLMDVSLVDNKFGIYRVIGCSECINF